MDIEKIKEIARKSFADKVDKGGNPYYDHLERIANSFPNNPYYNSRRELAYLHDLLEDCDEWNEKVLSYFVWDDTVKQVVIITKGKNEKYFDYINRIIDSEDEVVIDVKKADLRDNMDENRLSELTDKDIERLKKYHIAYKALESRTKITQSA